MFPFIIFTLAFGTVLGGTLDQKVPEFNHAVAKYVVNADHDVEEANGSTRNPK